MRLTTLHLLFVLAACAADQAQAQVPIAAPQWSVTFDRREHLDEGAYPQRRESWARTGDGKTVLLSRGNYQYPTLRTFDDEGQVIEERHLPGGGWLTAQIAAERQNSGVYALTAPILANLDPSRLYRYRPGSAPVQLAQVLKSPDVQVDPALALRVLEDDSVIVLNRRSVGRIGADGALRWFRYSEPISAGHFQPLALTQGPDGTLWLAGHGGPQDAGALPAAAAVWRLRSDGTFLSTQTFRCETCTDSRATGISVLPDGRAVAVGRSAAGEPGFIALFEADGTLFRRVDTPPGQGYDHVIHDRAGHVYLFDAQRGEVSAIDAGDGKLRWSRPGSDLAALDGGVLISQPVASPSGALTTDAYDSGGQLRWSRQIEAANGLAAGGAELGPDSVIRIFVTLTAAFGGDCGAAPRLHQLDMDGAPLGRLAACLRTGNPIIGELDSQSGAGVMADIRRAAEVLTPEGQHAWRYATCDFCNYGYWNIAAMHLQPDGSAWLLAQIPVLPPLVPQTELLRISADGQVQLRVALKLAVSNWYFRPALIGDAQQAIVLVPGSASLDWQRYSASGELREARRYDWNSPREGTQLRVQPLPDGGASLHMYRYDVESCQPSPGICGPNDHTVLRLDADGSPRWRVELGKDPEHIGLEVDGGATAFYSTIFFGEVLKLRNIDAAGTLGPFVEVADSAGNGFSHQISGPLNNRYRVLRVGSTPQTGQHMLVSRDGSVSARADAGPFAETLAYSAAGFLVSHNTEQGIGDAALLSAQDLAPVVRFAMGNLTPNYSSWPLWSITDSGDVYTTEQPVIDLLKLPRITRFAVPGTPAAEIIFIARFD